MQLLKQSFGAVLLLGLVGCSSSGGEFAGLIPLPKLTQGTLANSQYTAKDNSFSVKSPFSEGSNEYTYMKIEEHYSDAEDHIVFSSSAASAEVYRVDIYKNIKSQKQHHDSRQLEKMLLSRYVETFQNAYKTNLTEQKSETIPVGSLQAVSHTFVQPIPERSDGQRTAMAFTAVHSSYYLEDGNDVAFIWINRMSVSNDNPFRALVLRSAAAQERANQFINSFRMKKI